MRVIVKIIRLRLGNAMAAIEEQIKHLMAQREKWFMAKDDKQTAYAEQRRKIREQQPALECETKSKPAPVIVRQEVKAAETDVPYIPVAMQLDMANKARDWFFNKNISPTLEEYNRKFLLDFQEWHAVIRSTNIMLEDMIPEKRTIWEDLGFYFYQLLHKLWHRTK